MNVPATTIALPGLTHLEADELATVLQRAGADPASDLVVQPETGDAEDQYGEPFTLLAMVALGQITLSALAIYLTKERKHSTTNVRLRHRWPGGEEVEYTLEVDTSSEKATRADLLKQIAGLKIPMPKSFDGGSSDG